ncbi:GvpL/GvpF family gas vesicle protein [Streptomyces sp. NPDC014882]|uniref:GvpL/GvpF family gas vesicle protein n=1 Tax=Streptomyces sp. NPDC014882 TaxID=3364927 RepID=UPI0036F6CB18
MTGVPADRPTAAGQDVSRPCLTCLFAVTDGPLPDDVLAVTPGHDGGGPLRILEAGALRLVVQDVPVAAFGEEALARRLDRPEELERCARAHHRAVETAARAGAAVPLPMATLYLDDHNAVRAVTARQASLRTLLDRLRGRTEWAVKVYPAGPARTSGAASGGAADGGPADDGPSTGTPTAGTPATGGPATGGPAAGRSYLSRVSARRRTEREARESALAQADAVDRELRRYAVAATRHRPQSERLTGRGVPQLLNAAYLVDDDRRADFLGAVRRPGGAGGAAVEVTLSGPWVPYSFARLDEVTCDAREGVRA